MYVIVANRESYVCGKGYTGPLCKKAGLYEGWIYNGLSQATKAADKMKAIDPEFVWAVYKWRSKPWTNYDVAVQRMAESHDWEIAPRELARPSNPHYYRDPDQRRTPYDKARV